MRKEEPQLLVTPERLTKGKPDPQPFLLAAEKLGLTTQECLIFEDAPAGVKAGDAANCTVLALQTHFQAKQLPGADYYLHSLAQFTIVPEGELFSFTISDKPVCT